MLLAPPPRTFQSPRARSRLSLPASWTAPEAQGARGRPHALSASAAPCGLNVPRSMRRGIEGAAAGTTESTRAAAAIDD